MPFRRRPPAPRPRHRRCTRYSHHQWGTVRPTIGGWGLVSCVSCGFTDLT